MDARIAALLTLLAEHQETGIALNDLPPDPLSADYLTVADADGWIEFGKQNHIHVGDGPHDRSNHLTTAGLRFTKTLHAHFGVMQEGETVGDVRRRCNGEPPDTSVREWLRIGYLALPASASPGGHLIIEQGWTFSSVTGPNRKPMSAILEEWQADDPRIPHHVRLTAKGRIEASRLRVKGQDEASTVSIVADALARHETQRAADHAAIRADPEFQRAVAHGKRWGEAERAAAEAGAPYSKALDSLIAAHPHGYEPDSETARQMAALNFASQDARLKAFAEHGFSPAPANEAGGGFTVPSGAFPARDAEEPRSFHTHDRANPEVSKRAPAGTGVTEWKPPNGFIGAKAIQAEPHKVPRSTLSAWMRKDSPTVAVDPRTKESWVELSWLEGRKATWHKGKTVPIRNRNEV